MIIVLDASAAIEIALDKDGAKIFREALLDSDLVIAPDIYPSEITNVFWKYANISEIEQEKCIKYDELVVTNEQIIVLEEKIRVDKNR